MNPYVITVVCFDTTETFSIYADNLSEAMRKVIAFSPRHEKAHAIYCVQTQFTH